MSFSSLGLSEKVLAAVEAAGYTTPTPIQEQAIPVVLEKRDVIGIAQTGTGKTASFVLPMLTRIEQGRARARMPRTLILEPTRELAAQVEENFNKYGVNYNLTVALLIGGVSFNDQEKKLDRGADVLIATPGRLLDHFERGKLLMTGVEILVIDEADRMLDMGFIPDIERICKLIPGNRQTLMFSATMPPEIKRLADAFLKDPVRIEVARPSSTVKTVTQRLTAGGASDWEKRETLRRLIRSADDLKNAIVFCNRKRDVATLYKSLEKHGFNVGALHGDMDQRSRMATLDAFRAGRITLLVASDVAARGLDIPEVSHVYNFDVPIHAEDYVHRIGRTGRAGRSGTAISIVAPRDEKYLSAIESLIKEKIEWMGEATTYSNERPARGPSRANGPRDERRPPRTPEPRKVADGEPPAPRAPREHRRPEPATAVEPRAVEQRPADRARPHADRPDRNRARPRPQDSAPVQFGGSRPAREDRDSDGDVRVVGMGDHVPAFLLRPVPKIS